MVSKAQRDIRRKRQVLEYAVRIRNIRKTCRHFGIPRSLFYVWRAAFERDGEAGLVNRRPVARSHPRTTRPEVVEQVLHVRRTYHLGPQRIVWYLARYQGVSVSDATVYRILRRHGLRRLPNRVGRRAVPGAETSWHIPVTVTIYRKKVHHRATKNYQLDLLDPNDGHYEYSAVTSNLALTVRNVWYFACGRGNHEKTIAQLKTGLAFHSVPTQTYAANSAWQQLVVLAHNLLTNFPLETGAPPRRRTRKHTVVPLLQSVQTLRFELLHRAALLVRPGGKTRLRMTDNLPTRQTFTRIANALASG